MLNILVPITEKIDEFASFIKKHNDKNTKFYVGISEDLAQKLEKISSVEVHVFKNGTNKEQMINSLHKISLKKGKILVVRRPLSDDEFLSLTNSDADIATLKPRHNKFVLFFKNLAKKILRRVFAFSYFQDISAICFGQNMFELLSVCPNLSIATRIDKYVGVTTQEIETDQKTVKKTINNLKNNFLLALATSFCIASIVGGSVLFAFFKNMWAVFVLLIVAWWVVALFVFSITLLRFTRTLAVGDLDFEKAEELSKGVKNEKN